MLTAAAVVAVVFAVGLAVPSASPVVLRLGRLVATPGAQPGLARARPSPALAVLVTGCLVLVAGPPGAVLAVALFVLRSLWLRGHAERATRRQTALVARAVPLACDLMAGALDAGCSLGAAARIVADAVEPPLRSSLLGFAAAVAQGASDVEAAHVLEALGAPRLARALAVGDDTGAGVVSALRALATDERAAALAAARGAARRSAVWSVGPLTLCFLPAFVLVGIVPVVVSLLAGALG